MKNAVIIIAFFLLWNQFAFSQTLQGRYEGALTRDGSIQLISLDFTGSSATYDMPELGMYNVKSEKIFWRHDTLNISIYYGNFYCFMDKSTNEISGISQKWDPKIRLHLKSSEPQEKKFTEEEILFSSSSISLSGVIYKPKNVTNPIPLM